jgi:hypothetical protein
VSVKRAWPPTRPLPFPRPGEAHDARSQAPAERGRRPRNLHITERDRIPDDVRDPQDDLAERRAAFKDLPIVGDVRGTEFIYSCEPFGDLDDHGFGGTAHTEEVMRAVHYRGILDHRTVTRTFQMKKQAGAVLLLGLRPVNSAPLA